MEAASSHAGHKQCCSDNRHPAHPTADTARLPPGPHSRAGRPTPLRARPLAGEGIGTGDPFVLCLLRACQPRTEGSGRNRPPPCQCSNRTGRPRCDGLFGGAGIPAITRGGTTLTQNSLRPHNLRSHPHTRIRRHDSQINTDANSTTCLDKAWNNRLPAPPKHAWCCSLLTRLGPLSLQISKSYSGRTLYPRLCCHLGRDSAGLRGCPERSASA